MVGQGTIYSLFWAVVLVTTVVAQYEEGSKGEDADVMYTDLLDVVDENMAELEDVVASNEDFDSVGLDTATKDWDDTADLSEDDDTVDHGEEDEEAGVSRNGGQGYDIRPQWRRPSKIKPEVDGDQKYPLNGKHGWWFEKSMKPARIPGRGKQQLAAERRKHGSHGRHRSHHRRGHHTGRHHGGHRRRHSILSQMPMEKRVSIVCWKIQKRPHRRFMEIVRKKYKHGVGNVDRKHYRLEFVEKMEQCCKNNITRVECFVDMQHMRIDKFCDADMPLKPWARGKPRIYKKAYKLRDTCCSVNGSARYSCFDRTRRNESEDAIESFEEEMTDGYEEDIDIDDADTLYNLEKHPRKPVDQKKRWNPRHLCCRAGQTFVTKSTQEDSMSVECSRAARTFSLMMGSSRESCITVFERCCLGADKMTQEGADPVSDEDLDGDEPVGRHAGSGRKHRYDHAKAWKGPSLSWGPKGRHAEDPEYD